MIVTAKCSPDPSQCSPVWKTGTMAPTSMAMAARNASQCSPVWKTGTINNFFSTVDRNQDVSM